MNKIRMKWGVWCTALLLITMLFGSSALAFDDLPEGTDTDKIVELQQQGIISGKSDTRFAPEEALTYAQGVHLIVKTFNLNIDHIRFIKAPQASDYFKHIPDDAWYADAFIKAFHNGVTLDANVDPQAAMPREVFAHHAFEGLQATGNYAFIEIFKLIKDEADITPEYMNSIQKMLIIGAMKLDDQGHFLPKEPITRKQAALALHDLRNFVEGHKEVKPPKAPELLEDITMDIEAVNEDVQKITLSWGEKPNSGYRITIDRITFNEATMEANIEYKLHMPSNDPGISYLQVITYPKAETYISTQYTPVKQYITGQGTSGSHPGELPPLLKEEPVYSDEPVSEEHPVDELQERAVE